MLNQVVLVGKIINKTKLIENINGEKTAKITIAVPRAFKNKDGDYDKDLISVDLSENLVKNASNYIGIGDTIGIKGRIARLENEILHIVAEKVTFLSSKNTGDEDV